MATDPVLDALNITTLKEVYPVVINDQFFKGTPLQAYVKDHCMVPFGGGAFMQNTHLFAPMIGGAYAIGQTWNTTKRETLTATLFDPKYYEVAVPEYKEILQVLNKGPLALLSLLQTDLANAMNTLSAISAVDAALNGQTRPLNMNGWPEALNDGITPSWDGNIYTEYGTQVRNGVIGSALNSVPLWMGNPDGSVGPANYAQMEESYQTCSIGNIEPDLGVCNKLAYALFKERMQVQQRFAQERDPLWGATGLRFNNAIILKDDYFPSLRYGKNDPDLGNYLTGSFAVPAGVDPTSNLPAEGVTVTVGEVFCWFNTKQILFRLTDDAEYGYGFSGFLPNNDNSKIVGYIKAAQNYQYLGPRYMLQAYGLGV